MAATEAPWHVRAEAKYVRRSPRKAQLIVNEIRGLTVPEARTVLQFMPQAAARDVAKVLSSAAANAEANFGLISDELVVHEAYVGQGPTLRRFRARARGRVGRIRKPTCHIVLGLTDPPNVWDESVPLESVVHEAPVTPVPVEAEAEATPDEPYEGYEGATAKDVIARVKNLDDDQLVTLQRVDTRKTVQAAAIAELARRDDAAAADAADIDADASADVAEREDADSGGDDDASDDVDFSSQTAKEIIAQVNDLDDAQLERLRDSDERKTVQRAVNAEIERRNAGDVDTDEGES